MTKQSLAQGKAFDPNLGPMADDEAQMPNEASLGNYFRFYSTERAHQALAYRTPAEVFAPISTPVAITKEGMVESLTPDPLRIAGPNLNITPILS